MSLNSQSIAKAIKALKEISQSHNSEIMRIVAQDALDSEAPLEYLNSVCQYGCISGVVTDLIYYTDTHAFYDNHYDEIEAIRYDWEVQTGLKLQPEGDLKNWFAWFAYEQKCHELLS